MGKIYERIKAIVDLKGIYIKTIENDLGFANAYVKNIKDDTVPYARLKKIADYLGVDVNALVSDDEIPTDSTISAGFRDMMMLQDKDLAECMRSIYKLPQDKRNAIYEIVRIIPYRWVSEPTQ